MWMPTTEQEILAAVGAGHTEETPSFDANEALPVRTNPKTDPGGGIEGEKVEPYRLFKGAVQDGVDIPDA